jgi:probable addiction module antidote protein
MTKKLKTCVWDAADNLDTEEDMAAYLEAALENGDPAIIVAAFGDIVRAKGMTKIARDTDLGHESLYKTLSRDGNPKFATILKVTNALGLKPQLRRSIQLTPKPISRELGA